MCFLSMPRAGVERLVSEASPPVSKAWINKTFVENPNDTSKPGFFTQKLQEKSIIDGCLSINETLAVLNVSVLNECPLWSLLKKKKMCLNIIPSLLIRALCGRSRCVPCVQPALTNTNTHTCTHTILSTSQKHVLTQLISQLIHNQNWHCASTILPPHHFFFFNPPFCSHIPKIPGCRTPDSLCKPQANYRGIAALLSVCHGGFLLPAPLFAATQTAAGPGKRESRRRDGLRRRR